MRVSELLIIVVWFGSVIGAAALIIWLLGLLA